MLVVRLLLAGTFAVWNYRALSWIYDLRLFSLPAKLPTWAVLALAYLVVDFIFYWEHRLMHRVKGLWALHAVHHSSKWLNFSTSLRLSWVSPIFSPAFFGVACLVGFPPSVVIGVHALNLIYQLFLHTQIVGRLGPVEGLLNTPSAHRVHHGKNALYIDKNFGGTFAFWDRLFGTYQTETEAPVYGITTGYPGANPLVANLGPIWRWARGRLGLEGEATGGASAPRPARPSDPQRNPAFASVLSR
jgi:sterol desaturase/sphingolipid hydroxylase (fatty acid hydroxylase superfamily)